MHIHTHTLTHKYLYIYIYIFDQHCTVSQCWSFDNIADNFRTISSTTERECSSAWAGGEGGVAWGRDAFVQPLVSKVPPCFCCCTGIQPSLCHSAVGKHFKCIWSWFGFLQLCVRRDLRCQLNFHVCVLVRQECPPFSLHPESFSRPWAGSPSLFCFPSRMLLCLEIRWKCDKCVPAHTNSAKSVLSICNRKRTYFPLQ